MKESTRDGNKLYAWKHEGELLSELLQRMRNEFSISSDSPITYAGRLDPMAEGIVLLLINDAVHEKDSLLGLSKTYDVELLFGIESDTEDALGIVDGSHTVSTVKEATDAIQNFPKKYEQRYPRFSSKPVDGKPLFQHAREGRTVEVPTHEVTINSIEIKNVRTSIGNELAKQAIERIQKMNGDFRQEECAESWTKLAKEYKEKEFLLVDVTIVAEGGTYMRMLAKDIAEKMGTKGIAWKIVRTKIGK